MLYHAGRNVEDIAAMTARRYELRRILPRSCIGFFPCELRFSPLTSTADKYIALAYAHRDPECVRETTRPIALSTERPRVRNRSRSPIARKLDRSSCRTPSSRRPKSARINLLLRGGMIDLRTEFQGSMAYQWKPMRKHPVVAGWLAHERWQARLLSGPSGAC